MWLKFTPDNTFSDRLTSCSDEVLWFKVMYTSTNVLTCLKYIKIRGWLWNTDAPSWNKVLKITPGKISKSYILTPSSLSLQGYHWYQWSVRTFHELTLVTVQFRTRNCILNHQNFKYYTFCVKSTPYVQTDSVQWMKFHFILISLGAKLYMENLWKWP